MGKLTIIPKNESTQFQVSGNTSEDVKAGRMLLVKVGDYDLAFESGKDALKMANMIVEFAKDHGLTLDAP